jgi:TfoX/Sxy family transcriptional regulator of competence genes
MGPSDTDNTTALRVDHAHAKYCKESGNQDYVDPAEDTLQGGFISIEDSSCATQGKYQVFVSPLAKH